MITATEAREQANRYNEIAYKTLVKNIKSYADVQYLPHVDTASRDGRFFVDVVKKGGEEPLWHINMCQYLESLGYKVTETTEVGKFRISW